jgi:flagellar basal body L-ring protein FlgH
MITDKEATHLDNPMFTLAQKLVDLRDEKDELERQTKEVNGEISDTELALVELMAATETQNFTRAGRMFSLTSKVRASAAGGRKEELFEALRAHEFGDLITETVNANSLSSFVKEQTAENSNALPGWLSGLVNVFEQTGISIRKATKKS